METFSHLNKTYNGSPWYPRSQINRNTVALACINFYID